jgi:hypothetical protein
MFDGGADSGRPVEMNTGQTSIPCRQGPKVTSTPAAVAASRMRMGCPLSGAPSQQCGSDHQRACPSVVDELSEPPTPLCAWLSSHRVSPV